MAAAAWGCAALVQYQGWLNLLPFAVLAVGTQLLATLLYPAWGGSLTAAILMSAVTARPETAPVVGLCAGLMSLVATRGRRLEAALLGIASPVVAAAAAAWIYREVMQAFTLANPGLFPALLSGTALLHAIHMGHHALAGRIEPASNSQGAFRDITWFTPITLITGVAGGLFLPAYRTYGPEAAAMLVLSVLAVRHVWLLYARRVTESMESAAHAREQLALADREKDETLRQVIVTVAMMIDLRDHSVSGHSQRVARYAAALGRDLGLDPSELGLLYTAGLLHDVGKFAVPEAILHKPSRLTSKEYDVVKEHAPVGERILAEVAPLQEVARLVGDHHEKYDGTGYPRGTRGAAITLGGRILAVADALDTILTDRPYAKARDLDWAITEMDRCVGTHFDPAVVAALHRLVASAGPGFFSDGGKAQVANDPVSRSAAGAK